MSSEVEPARQLLPYLQRADELQKHEPLVAYYCRLFAMEKGLKIPNKERTKMTNSILISLMNQLEKDKKSVQISSDDGLYLEGFASNVFAKADKQDRAGRADLNTAKTFYAASIFFEILHQFGELQPDIEQKQKYALWKAADIRKALKEGRKPEPGPPGGEDDLSISSTPESKINEDSHSVAATQRESFSADQPGPEFQHPEDSIHRSLSSTPSSRSVYPGSDFHPGNLPPSSPSRHDDSVYAPPHHLQTQSFEQQYLPPPVFPPHDTRPHSYSHELQPPNVPSEVSPPQYAHESPSPQFSYPSFQTYPSFSESNIPATSGHYSAYYQGSESAFLQQQPPPQDYTPPKQYHANDSNNGSHAGYAPPPLSASPAVTPTQYSAGSDNGSYGGHVPPLSVASIPSYTYDCNYQPPIEKIAEAHKAARFAVGALAFDDVAVAVEFLRKSLELLTNPKAEIH